jgi:hypothetical protein
MTIKLKWTLLLIAASIGLIWLIYFMSYSKKIDGFEETSYPKTIYLIWRNMSPIPGNDATHAGFGDKIRGAIALYQYCRINQVNLKIDIHQDTSQHYLNFPSVETKYNDHELHDIGGDFTTMTNTLNELLTNQKKVYCGCSVYPGKLTNEDKVFAKHLLEPTPKFKKDIDARVATLPPSYGIKHYRFKDELEGQDISNETFFRCFNNLKSTLKETDVLMTNSSSFRKYAVENLKIKIVECKESEEETCNIAHIGMTPDYKSSKFSYIEFFCICRAKYIDSYSEYAWVSGFVQWPSSIFDIPISQISL